MLLMAFLLRERSTKCRCHCRNLASSSRAECVRCACVGRCVSLGLCKLSQLFVVPWSVCVCGLLHDDDGEYDLDVCGVDGRRHCMGHDQLTGWAAKTPDATSCSQ